MKEQKEKKETYWDKERLAKFWGKNPTQEFNDMVESSIIREGDYNYFITPEYGEMSNSLLAVEIAKAKLSNAIDTKAHTNKRVFDTGSQRDDDTNKPLPNHLDAYVRMRYGYLLRHGANHYDKGNWRKGQPTEAALESLHRHLAKFEMNLYNGVEQDEDHLSAIIFGCQLIMKNEEKEGIKTDQYYKPIANEETK
jgi:hypothetical protein